MCANCESGKNFDFSKIDYVLDEYGAVKGSLIAILQKAQDIYGYLSPAVINRIAERTGIRPSKILGVVTFYTQFRQKPVGKNLILLCQGTACHVLGSAAIEQAILTFLSAPGAPLKEGEISADGLFTVQSVACLGCCSLAPVMMINGETFGNLTAGKTKLILQNIIEAEKAAGSK